MLQRRLRRETGTARRRGVKSEVRYIALPTMDDAVFYYWRRAGVSAAGVRYRCPPKAKVVCSNHAGRANLIKDLRKLVSADAKARLTINSPIKNEGWRVIGGHSVSDARHAQLSDNLHLLVARKPAGRRRTTPKSALSVQTATYVYAPTDIPTLKECRRLVTH